jgi:GalNAc-alpha-(1->4)-GalNAc-alpha-(1->3)-diNAcBac-PP-undecaprenol alpha-1,4-N-acetyl-D-galactosaminyltransferase
MNKLVFFCPFIYDGGLEKTLKIYSDYFSKFYNVTIITNSKYKSYIKFSKKIKIINPSNKYFYSNRYLNNIYCVYLIFKNFTFKDKIYSIQDHIFLLLINFFFLKKFKIIIRTSTAITNNKNDYENKNLKKFKLAKALNFIVYRIADLIITFSNDNKKYLYKITKKKNIFVIYNYFKINSKIKRFYNKKTFNIFFIGRLVDDKNPIFFLNSLKKIYKTYNIKSHIVGKGELSSRIIQILKENSGLGHYYGFKLNPFKKFLKKIDIFCVTSKYDGTPNVLGEALSYGIPVLAPNKVGLSNLILDNGNYGFLYKPDSRSSFNKKIIQMIYNYNLALKKAEKGRVGLNRFDKIKTLKKLKLLIDKL